MKTKTPHLLFLAFWTSLCLAVCGCMTAHNQSRRTVFGVQRYRLFATGTGFAISTNGYFLTNCHVVEDADQVRIKMESSDKEIVARVVRTDPKTDLALLKVDGTFEPVRFAADTDVKLGEDIRVLGYPDTGLHGTSIRVTTGSVSSENGMRDDVQEFQMDATIQPGNSGGPVINENGEVIGVTVSKLDEEEVRKRRGYTPQNVNYAIKAAFVTAFLRQTPCKDQFLRGGKPASGMESAIAQVRKSTALVRVYKYEYYKYDDLNVEPQPAALDASQIGTPGFYREFVITDENVDRQVHAPPPAPLTKPAK